MFSADYIVLMDELRDGVNAKFERWWEALESKEFNISHTKIEYINYNFNNINHNFSTDVQRCPMRIEALQIPQIDSFWNFGSIISKYREIDKDAEQYFK